MQNALEKVDSVDLEDTYPFQSLFYASLFLLGILSVNIYI